MHLAQMEQAEVLHISRAPASVGSDDGFGGWAAATDEAVGPSFHDLVSPGTSAIAMNEERLAGWVNKQPPAVFHDVQDAQQNLPGRCPSPDNSYRPLSPLKTPLHGLQQKAHMFGLATPFSPRCTDPSLLPTPPPDSSPSRRVLRYDSPQDFGLQPLHPYSGAPLISLTPPGARRPPPSRERTSTPEISRPDPLTRSNPMTRSDPLPMLTPAASMHSPRAAATLTAHNCYPRTQFLTPQLLHGSPDVGRSSFSFTAVAPASPYYSSLPRGVSVNCPSGELLPPVPGAPQQRPAPEATSAAATSALHVPGGRVRPRSASVTLAAAAAAEPLAPPPTSPRALHQPPTSGRSSPQSTTCPLGEPAVASSAAAGATLCAAATGPPIPPAAAPPCASASAVQRPAAPANTAGGNSRAATVTAEGHRREEVEAMASAYIEMYYGRPPGPRCTSPTPALSNPACSTLLPVPHSLYSFPRATGRIGLYRFELRGVGSTVGPCVEEQKVRLDGEPSFVLPCDARVRVSKIKSVRGQSH